MSNVTHLRLVSDIHLDFDADRWARLPNLSPERIARMPEHEFAFPIPALPTDPTTCLILAGDLWSGNSFFERRFGLQTCWLEEVAKRFAQVVLVLGNHDYWGGNLQRAVPKARESLVKLSLVNVHLLEQSAVDFGNVKLLGGTFWTDYDRSNPTLLYQAPFMLNDYAQMRSSNSHRRVRPSDIYEVHRQTAKYIRRHATRDHAEQKVVVVTHMSPSLKSIDERYDAAGLINYLYASDLEQTLMTDVSKEVDLWVHGHTHTPFDYEAGGIRVLCNPRGYFPHEQTGYNPALVLEVSQLC